MDKKILIPHKPSLIINVLEENGYEAYVVGGCVRDSLLGIEPHDWDICTSALPEQVIEVFKEYKVLLTGIKHGTVTVLIENEPFEVTTYRVDGEYKNNRHPSSVEFVSDLKSDLMRRDFTINAMAYNDKDGLIDLFGGVNDINNKVIRCVGDSDERFSEDALRMLRSIRFAVRFNFNINKETVLSILAHKSLLKNISVERISSELTKIIGSPNKIKSTFLILLLERLLESIIPSVQFIDSDILYRLIRSKPLFKVRLATLFDCRNIENILRQLKFSNNVINDVVSIRRCGYKILAEKAIWKDAKCKYFSKTLLRDLSYENIKEAIEFAKLISYDKHDYDSLQYLMVLNNYISQSYYDGSVYTLSKLDINGNDLIELGYKGKEIGSILNRLLDLVMKDLVPNEKDKLINCIHAEWR